jgi:GDP-4-dehydro-6-deoxy-D-mannose reductase
VSASCFVTGGGGFVGRHLVAHLEAAGERVVAPSRAEVDLNDEDAIRAAIGAAQPDSVFHLAAQASVIRAWTAPRETLVDNLTTTVNLLEAVRLEAPGATLVLASSGEVYGPPERLPVEEGAALRPQNPYAVSKAACDVLGGQYADAHGMSVIRTRAFNQAGPGQSDDYVIGTITRQVADAELAGRDAAVLKLGNVDARRDFTDVRDVARAYASLTGRAAGVYNICRGSSVSVAEIIDLVRASARVEVRYEVDPSRVRSHEVMDIRGSADLLRAETGWAPEIPLERTVADALDEWRSRLASG